MDWTCPRCKNKYDDTMQRWNCCPYHNKEICVPCFIELHPDVPEVKAYWRVMGTRTHTHFWSEDDLTPLLTETAKLREDYEHRIEDNVYLPLELRIAAKDRIDNLDIAIRLMGDRAD